MFNWGRGKDPRGAGDASSGTHTSAHTHGHTHTHASGGAQNALLEQLQRTTEAYAAQSDELASYRSRLAASEATIRALNHEIAMLKSARAHTHTHAGAHTLSHTHAHSQSQPSGSLSLSSARAESSGLEGDPADAGSAETSSEMSRTGVEGPRDTQTHTHTHTRTHTHTDTHTHTHTPDRAHADTPGGPRTQSGRTGRDAGVADVAGGSTESSDRDRRDVAQTAGVSLLRNTRVLPLQRSSPFFDLQLKHASDRFAHMCGSMGVVATTAREFDHAGTKFVDAGERLAAALAACTTQPWCAAAGAEALRAALASLATMLRDVSSCVRAVTSSTSSSLGSSIEIGMFSSIHTTQAAIKRAMVGAEIAESAMTRLMTTRKGATLQDLATRTHEVAAAQANHELARLDAVVAVHRLECTWRTGLADRIATVISSLRAFARQLADVAEEHDSEMNVLAVANDRSREELMQREKVWRQARDYTETQLMRACSANPLAGDDAGARVGTADGATAGAAPAAPVDDASVERVIGVGLRAGTNDAGIDTAASDATAVRMLRRLQHPLDSVQDAIRDSILMLQRRMDDVEDAEVNASTSQSDVAPGPAQDAAPADAVPVPGALWPGGSAGVRVAGWLYKRSTNSMVKQWLPRWFFVRGGKLWYLGGDEGTPKPAVDLVTANIREILATIGAANGVSGDAATPIGPGAPEPVGPARSTLSAVAGSALAAFSTQTPASGARLQGRGELPGAGAVIDGTAPASLGGVSATLLEPSVGNIPTITAQSYAYSHAFEVIGPSKTLILAAPTLAQRQAWVLALRSIAEEALTVGPLRPGARAADESASRRASVDAGDGVAESAAAVLEHVDATAPISQSSPLLPLIQRLETCLASRTDIAVGMRAIRTANPSCVDCSAPAPDWASINLGCVFCVACSGVHRSLGVHISKVRSLVLDEWDPQHIALVLRLGNAAVNATYEADMDSQPGWHRPTPDAPRSERERFIRAKYEHKAFVRLQDIDGMYTAWREFVTASTGADLGTASEATAAATSEIARRRGSVLAEEAQHRAHQATELLIAACRCGDVLTALHCMAAGAFDVTLHEDESPILRVTDDPAGRPAHTYAPLQDAAMYGQLSSITLLTLSHEFDGTHAIGSTTRHAYAPLAALTWALIAAPLSIAPASAPPASHGFGATAVQPTLAWASALRAVRLDEHHAQELLHRTAVAMQLTKAQRADFMARVAPILQARFREKRIHEAAPPASPETPPTPEEAGNEEALRRRDAVEVFKSTFLRKAAPPIVEAAAHPQRQDPGATGTDMSTDEESNISAPHPVSTAPSPPSESPFVTGATV